MHVLVDSRFPFKILDSRLARGACWQMLYADVQCPLEPASPGGKFSCQPPNRAVSAANFFVLSPIYFHARRMRSRSKTSPSRIAIPNKSVTFSSGEFAVSSKNEKI